MNNKLVMGAIVAVVVAVAAYFIMTNAGKDTTGSSSRGGALMRTNKADDPVVVGIKPVKMEMLEEFEKSGEDCKVM